MCVKPASNFLKYRARCNEGRQCVTKYCDVWGSCTCRGQHIFNACTQTCVPECGSTISSPSTGRLSGPNYPNNNESYTCSWTITGQSSTSYVVLSLTDLDLQQTSNCTGDFIEVTDKVHSLQLFRSCDTNDTSVHTIASKSNSLRITVKQTSYGYRSFNGIYRILDKYSSIADNFGYIASPGFPDKYPQSYKMSWTLLGNFVTLKILTLDFEVSYDKLLIYKGASEGGPLLETIDKITSPYTVRSQGGGMHIVFTSDSSNEKSGFNAMFYSQELKYGEKCELTIPGMCKPPDLTCRYDINNEPSCMCEYGSYQNDYNCSNDISVGLTVYDVFVSVTLPRIVHTVNYSLTGYDTSGGTTYRYIMNITATSFNVTGLTPGLNYTFQIYSNLGQETQDVNRSIGLTDAYRFVTLPAKTVDIRKDESKLKQASYVFKFQPSRRIVQYYQITLQSMSRTQSLSAEMKVADLAPNRGYNNNITASNELGNKRETTTGSFTTGSGNEVLIQTSIANYSYIKTSFNELGNTSETNIWSFETELEDDSLNVIAMIVTFSVLATLVFLILTTVKAQCRTRGSSSRTSDQLVSLESNTNNKEIKEHGSARP